LTQNDVHHKQFVQIRGKKMTEFTVWWALAGGLVGIELLTGTFYLLMLATGAVAAALAAHAGVGMVWQTIAAAVVGGGAVALWHCKRERSPSAIRATANKDVNMDIGGTVNVDYWDTEQHTTVRYRGANWGASLSRGAVVSLGAHRIVEVLGSRLIVQPVGTAATI